MVPLAADLAREQTLACRRIRTQKTIDLDLRKENDLDKTGCCTG